MTYRGEKRNAYRISGGKNKAGDHLEDKDVVARMLICMFKN